MAKSYNYDLNHHKFELDPETYTHTPGYTAESYATMKKHSIIWFALLLYI